MSASKVKSWSDWFERAAQTFDDPRMKIAYYKNGQTGEPYSEEAVKATHQDIFTKLAPQKTDILLDVGCGVGYFTKHFGHRVKKIVGTDVSSHMIETAKHLNPGNEFLVAPAHTLPLKGKLFDKIFSYGVTQYLPDEKTVQEMLDEMRRLLKPDGRILIGDILEPVEQDKKGSYKRTTAKGKRWWPQSLDHDLTKLYLSRDFFLSYSQRHDFICKFFEQKIAGRSIPTPRYDVVMDAQ